jgi:Big-like domain-containing protein
MRKTTARGMAFRVAGVASVLALAGLALIASPAAAAAKTTTTTITTNGPAYSGSTIVFTATVVHNDLTPTGTVTFSVEGADDSTPMCQESSTNIVGLQMASTGASATCTIVAGLSSVVSPYMVTATYSGDSTFAGSMGTLTKAVHPGPTATTVTSTTAPSVTGQAVSFTAQVAPTSPSTGVPTGSVVFSITGQSGASFTCDDVGGDTQTLSGSDLAQCDIPTGDFLVTGSPYTVSAAYSGDSNYAASSGSTTQNVYKATATIAVASSSSTLVNGQPVTFTATVTGITPPGSGTPTGSVVFSVVGNNAPPTTATCEGGDTVSLGGTSSAACTFPKGLSSVPLSYNVSATLQDDNFKTPAAGTLVQSVGRAASTVLLGAVPSSLVASQSFDFTATVKTVSPGTGAPTGYLEWAICQNEATQCTPTTGTKGNTMLLPSLTTADKTKSQNKVGIAVPEGLTPGFYDVTASYEGDAAQSSSTSSVGHIEVTQVPTTVQIFENHNPVAFGGKLKIRAAVIADARATESLGAPTGTVTFTITGATTGDTLTCSNATTNMVTISTTAQNQGIANCAIPAGVLMSGDSPYRIKAVYSGDSNYETAKGADLETVDPAPGS